MVQVFGFRICSLPIMGLWDPHPQDRATCLKLHSSHIIMPKGLKESWKGNGSKAAGKGLTFPQLLQLKNSNLFPFRCAVGHNSPLLKIQNHFLNIQRWSLAVPEFAKLEIPKKVTEEL